MSLCEFHIYFLLLKYTYLYLSTNYLEPQPTNALDGYTHVSHASAGPRWVRNTKTSQYLSTIWAHSFPLFPSAYPFL